MRHNTKDRKGQDEEHVIYQHLGIYDTPKNIANTKILTFLKKDLWANNNGGD